MSLRVPDDKDIQRSTSFTKKLGRPGGAGLVIDADGKTVAEKLAERPTTEEAGDAFAPKLETAEALGERPTIADLADPTMASNLGTTGGGNVQADLDAKLDASTPLDADGSGLATFTILQSVKADVRLEQYYRSTDGTSPGGPLMQNAFERALATGAKKIIIDHDEYQVDDTVVIDRHNVVIVGPGEALGSINMRGSTSLLFDIGRTDAACYHIYLEGLIVTRSSAVAGSHVARINNVSYFGLSKSRFYMDNKFGTGLEIHGGIYHDYSAVKLFRSIDHNVRVYGGANAAGLVDGWAVGHRWERCVFDGANAGKSNPEEQASFISEDYVQAMWMLDCEGYRHLGALVDLRGTSGNASINSLNMFRNLNVEVSTGLTGNALRVGHYSNTELSGSWAGGRNMPTVILGVGSNASRIINNQLVVEDADFVHDYGASNRIEGGEFVGYSNGGAAVRYKAGSSKGIFKGGEVTQASNIVVNEAGTESGHRVSDVDSSLISSTPVVGFGAGNNVASDIRSSDASPYYVQSGPNLSNLPWGLGDEVISMSVTAGNIDSIRPGYWRGEEVTIIPPNGSTIRDISTSSGNIVLATGGGSIACNGRTMVTFKWIGSEWYLKSVNGA